MTTNNVKAIGTKLRLIFKMRNDDIQSEIICTHRFIGHWQSRDFYMVGFLAVPEDVSLMQVSVSDVPDNIV